MRFLTRSLVGLVLFSLTVGLISFGFLTLSDAIAERNADSRNERPARERVYAAAIMRLEPQTIQPTLSVFGEVRSRRTLEVRTQSAGTVVTLHPAFEEGGRVRSGDILAQIDPRDAETALQKAQTDLDEARADQRDAARSLDLARDDVAAAEAQLALQGQALQRQRNLLERGVGTEAAVEAAQLTEASALQSLLSRRTAFAAAEARIDQTTTRVARREIEVSEAQDNLTETTIVAAFDGTLANASAVVGGVVNANEQIAQLVDPTALEVAFRVSAAQYLRLLGSDGRLRQTDVAVTLDVLGASIAAQGRLTRAAALVGEGQTGRLLFAELRDAPAFRPGDFVTVAAPEPEIDNVVQVPASAVGSDSTILLLGEEDRLELVSIAIVRRQVDDMIINVGGHAGREVVIDRSPLLGEGIKVRPIRTDATSEVQTAQAAPQLITLDPQRRARLVAFVEGNTRMPEEAKARVLLQLTQEQVPARVIDRIESRMGG